MMSTNPFILNSLNFYKLLHHHSKISYLRYCVASNRNMSTPPAQLGDIQDMSKQGQGLLTIFEKNPKRFQRIKFLHNLFDSAGYELRIAGGAVRDILRGVEPQDIDLATTARPEQSMAILEKHEDLVRIIVTTAGQKHGTVGVKFKGTEIDLKRIKLHHSSDHQETNKPDGTAKKQVDKPEYDEESPYEITTLRCDCITDGRHAEVKFINDWRQDAERRDLTINAMFLTLDKGELIDYYNGASDLKNGVVRFVGNADLRIKEDYIRILRFFRFWSRYGRHNQPNSETLGTLRDNLDGLSQISGERIWVEIKKIFGALPCYEVVELMLKLQLFDYLGLKDNNDSTDVEEYQKVCLNEIKIVQLNVSKYMTLNEDISSVGWKKFKDLLPAIIFSTVIKTTDAGLSAHKRMKFSNLERDTINHIVENRAKPPSTTSQKYLLAMAPRHERPQMFLAMKALLIYKGDFNTLNELESWQIPDFPMPGHVVTQEIKKRKLPGSHIKEILESLKTEWATSDYKLSTKELEQKMLDMLDRLGR